MLEAPTKLSEALQYSQTVFLLPADRVLLTLSTNHEVKEKAVDTADEAEKAQLLEELQAAKVKYNPAAIVKIARTKDGKIVFLEQGVGKAQSKKPSGLSHIVEEHRNDFARKGIPEDQIPDAVMKAVIQGKVVGTTGRDRPIYEVELNGRTHHIAVTIGGSGYIVGANPIRR